MSVSAASPSRASQSQTEVFYNTAVQSFVRRDHLKTHTTLSRLLEVLRSHPRATHGWYQLDVRAGADDGYDPARGTEEWIIKSLKLVISAYISLFTESPSDASTFPIAIRSLLPPSPPKPLFVHLNALLIEFYPTGLPPQVVSTLLLGALKVKPAQPALEFAHRVAEEWFTALPDAFVLAISPRGAKPPDLAGKKRVEGAREGYLKVVELFVGEVLTREGEWEMARAFLEDEVVMTSKRKENLYRHLRSMPNRPTSSPSSSMIISSPSASGSLPDPSSPTPYGSRSRSASASSSSSEATARPASGALPRPNGSIKDMRAAPAISANQAEKGKGKAQEDTPRPPPSISSESTLPSKLYLNHPPSPSPRPGINSLQSRFANLFSSLPPAISHRIAALARYPWLFLLPLPAIALGIAILIVRRRRHRTRTSMASPAGIGGAVKKGSLPQGAGPALLDASPAGIGGSLPPAASRAAASSAGLTAVRKRLRRVQQRGYRAWALWWLRWWIGKIAGVWRMGTTISYV